MKGRRFKQRIAIQRNDGTKSTKGDITAGWVGIATRWATPLPTNGREVYQIQQQIAQVNTVFRVRYDEITKTITPKMRIYYRSAYYDIKAAINEEEKDKYILIACERVY